MKQTRAGSRGSDGSKGDERQLSGAARRDAMRLSELTARNDGVERWSRKCEEELEELEREEVELTEQVEAEVRKRGEHGGVNASKLKLARMGRKMKELQAELGRARSTEDKVDGALEELRNTINERRQAHLVQNRLYGEIRGQLVHAQSALIELLDTSNATAAETEALEKRRSEVIELEIKRKEADEELDQKLVRDLRLVQTGKYVGDDVGETRVRGDDLGPDEPGSGDLTEEEERKLVERTQELDRLMARVHEDIKNVSRQTTHLQTIFKRMLAQAEVSTLDELVGMFKGEEAYKYEQYGYIQRLDDETKAFEDALRAKVHVIEEEHRRQEEENQRREKQIAEKRAELDSTDAVAAETAGMLRDGKRIARAVILKALQCYTAIGGRNPRVQRLKELAEFKHSEDDSPAQKPPRTRRGSYVRVHRGSFVEVTEEERKMLEREDAKKANPGETGGKIFVPEIPAHDAGPPFLISGRSVDELLASLEQGVAELVAHFVGFLRTSGSRRLVLSIIEDLQAQANAPKDQSPSQDDKLPHITPVPSSPQSFTLPTIPAMTPMVAGKTKHRLTEADAEAAFNRFHAGPVAAASPNSDKGGLSPASRATKYAPGTSLPSGTLLRDFDSILSVTDGAITSARDHDDNTSELGTPRDGKDSDSSSAPLVVPLHYHDLLRLSAPLVDSQTFKLNPNGALGSTNPPITARKTKRKKSLHRKHSRSHLRK